MGMRMSGMGERCGESFIWKLMIVNRTEELEYSKVAAICVPRFTPLREFEFLVTALLTFSLNKTSRPL